MERVHAVEANWGKCPLYMTEAWTTSIVEKEIFFQIKFIFLKTKLREMLTTGILPTPELLLRKEESKDNITKDKDRADVWLGYSKTILSTYRRKDRGTLKWLCLACIRLH